MSGANGVTFGCVNTAAPADPQQQQAAAKDSKDKDGAKEEGAGKEEGGEDKEAAAAAHAAGLVRTWAFRTKGEDKVLALLAALERAKDKHSSGHAVGGNIVRYGGAAGEGQGGGLRGAGGADVRAFG